VVAGGIIEEWVEDVMEEEFKWELMGAKSSSG